MSAVRQALNAQQEERRRRLVAAQLLATPSAGRDPSKPYRTQVGTPTAGQPPQFQQQGTKDLAQPKQLCAGEHQALTLLRRKHPTAAFLATCSEGLKGAVGVRGGSSILAYNPAGPAPHLRVPLPWAPNSTPPVQPVPAIKPCNYGVNTPPSCGVNARPTSQAGIERSGVGKLPTRHPSKSVAAEVCRLDLRQSTNHQAVDRAGKFCLQSQTSDSNHSPSTDQALASASSNIELLYGILVGPKWAAEHRMRMAKCMESMRKKWREQTWMTAKEFQNIHLLNARNLHFRLTVAGALAELRLKQLLAQRNLISPLLRRLVSETNHPLTSGQLRAVLGALRPELLQTHPLWDLLTRESGVTELRKRRVMGWGQWARERDLPGVALDDQVAKIRAAAVLGVLLLAAAPETDSGAAVTDKDLCFLSCAALGVLYRRLRSQGGCNTSGHGIHHQQKEEQEQEKYPSGTVLQISPRLLYSLLWQDVFISTGPSPSLTSGRRQAGFEKMMEVHRMELRQLDLESQHEHVRAYSIAGTGGALKTCVTDRWPWFVSGQWPSATDGGEAAGRAAAPNLKPSSIGAVAGDLQQPSTPLMVTVNANVRAAATDQESDLIVYIDVHEPLPLPLLSPPPSLPEQPQPQPCQTRGRVTGVKLSPDRMSIMAPGPLLTSDKTTDSIAPQGEPQMGFQSTRPPYTLHTYPTESQPDEAIPMDTSEVSYSLKFYGHLMGNVLPSPVLAPITINFLSSLCETVMKSLTLVAWRDLRNVQHGPAAAGRVLRLLRGCDQLASRLDPSGPLGLAGARKNQSVVMVPAVMGVLRKQSGQAQVARTDDVYGPWGMLTCAFSRAASRWLGRVGERNGASLSSFSRLDPWSELVEMVCPGLLEAHADSWGQLVGMADRVDAGDKEVDETAPGARVTRTGRTVELSDAISRSLCQREVMLHLSVTAGNQERVDPHV